MSRLVFLVPLLFIAACTGREGASAVTSAPKAQTSPGVVTKEATIALPPEACTRAGYKAFFEAFVRTPKGRRGWALPGAPLRDFDVSLLDYSWVLASNEETQLDIDEDRVGDEFTVRARPVERDENDEVVKVIGAERTYRFKYADGCWKFASAH